MLVKFDISRRTVEIVDTSLPAALTVSAEEPIQVLCLSQLSALVIPAGAAIKIELKKKGSPDDAPLGVLILTPDDASQNVENRYEGLMDLVNEAVIAALKIGVPDDEDITKLPCVLVLAYRATELGGFVEDLTKLEVYLLNTYIREDDPAPLSKHYGSIQNLPDVVGLTGGGSTKLDGIPTEDIDVPVIVTIYVSAELQHWRLAAGTDAEASPSIIRPDDYAADTNEKVWTRIL